jgi:hypothetical protein
MTTPADDADARIAGASRRAPKGHYTIDLPNGAHVSLARRHGRWQWTIALTITPEAAAHVQTAGGSASTAVAIEPHIRHGAEHNWPLDARAAALRGLLLERALLANAAWLVDASARPTDLTDDERWLLRAMGLKLAAALGASGDGALSECAGCHELRTAGFRSDLNAIEQAVITRTQNGRRLTSQQVYELSRRLWEVRAKGPPPLEAACPHMAMMGDAPAALAATHPEVAFEMAGLLGLSSDGKRFVLGSVFETAVLPQWLTGRTRDDYGYGTSYARRYRPRRTSPWTSIRDRARAAQELPKEQRAGITYAATAWGISASLGAYGWTPPAEPVADSVLRADAEEAPLDVAAQVPSFAVVKRAPPPPPPKPEKTAAQTAAAKTVAAKAEKTAKPTKAEKAAAKAPEAPKPAKAPKPPKAPKPAKAPRAVTRDVLRAIGISDALLDEMVREGRLVKLGDDLYAHPAEVTKPRR